MRMGADSANGCTGMLLGYASTSSKIRTLEAQIDALTAAGIEPARIYSDGVVTAVQRRPGWTALLDYARSGDTVVVLGIDRLGRTTREVLATARDLSDRHIELRSLREGIDTADSMGAMIVGVLASLAEHADEFGNPGHTAAAASRPDNTSPVGRPRALDDGQVAVAEQMRIEGQTVPTIAAALGVSRATLYRTLAERRSVH